MRLLAPFTPHMAEELWAKLGLQPSVATAPWPEFDPAQLVDDAVQMPIAIKGKVRSHLLVPKAAPPANSKRSRSPTNASRNCSSVRRCTKSSSSPAA